MAKKRIMKKAETTTAPEMKVATKLLASLERVHMRKKKF